MRLHDFLSEAYSSNRDIKLSINYALKYLTYLDWGNEKLVTKDVHYLGDEREVILSGDEISEKGYYTLYTGAHDGIEWLQRYSSLEDALRNKEEWDTVKFSHCDTCFLKEVN